MRMIRRLTRRFLREEDGIALVIAIASMAILAITTTGVIVAGTANEDTAWVSMKGRSAFAVAQQALAYGEGMVYGDIAARVQPPTATQNLPTQPNGATGTFTSSTFDGVSWHIVATGTIGGVTRTVFADVTPAQTITTQGYALWHYLYEDAANPGCVGGGAVITMPILAHGNFCVQGAGTKILGTLEVGGNLSTSTNSQVGTSSSPVTRLRVVGTCNTVTPGTGACNGTTSPIFASGIGQTLDANPVMPTVDFQSNYNAQALLTQTGCPAGLFDNDTTMNNSVVDVGLIMLGSTDYDCHVGTNEIKWNHTTSALYVHGTLYFDGSLSIHSSIQYTGQASLYFTGGVKGNSAQLCGIASCTTSWNPDQNLIVFVADCVGLTTKCINLQGNSTMQFACFVTTEYFVAGGSVNMGPVLSNTFNLNGSGNLLIPVDNFPPGTPTSATITTIVGQPPSGWSG
jgi:hypothetical protein